MKTHGARACLGLLACLLAMGCQETTGVACSDIVRQTESTGTALDASGTVVATAIVGIAEGQSGEPAVVGLSLFGTSMLIAGPLRGHVRVVRVVDVAGRVIFAPSGIDQLPAGDTGGGALIRSVTLSQSDVERARSTRALLLSNSLVVEIETTYPGAALVRIPLRLTNAIDFGQLVCV